MASLPLSVLDLSTVAANSSGPQALQDTLALGRLADRLGFRRFWLAEHHNLPSVASSAPEVMIGHVASRTRRIRVGSGGIMLPNHSSLKVAELFRVLEALHPGRIDLGLGRAPGTDPVTAAALRRTTMQAMNVDTFPHQLEELLMFGSGGVPSTGGKMLQAVPTDVPLPPIWILGSSDFGAMAAAQLGAGFAHAAHINPHGAESAMRAYLENFNGATGLRENPEAMLAVSVVAADTAEEAEQLAAPGRLAMVRLRSGTPAPLPTVEEALAHEYTPMELALLRQMEANSIVGDIASVKVRLDELVERTGAHELMITSQLPDAASRERSYTLLAEAYGLEAEENLGGGAVVQQA